LGASEQHHQATTAKSESRNPKSEANPKPEGSNDRNNGSFGVVLSLESFEIRICFGFRYSVFGFIPEQDSGTITIRPRTLDFGLWALGFGLWAIPS